MPTTAEEIQGNTGYRLPIEICETISNYTQSAETEEANYQHTTWSLLHRRQYEETIDHITPNSTGIEDQRIRAELEELYNFRLGITDIVHHRIVEGQQPIIYSVNNVSRLNPRLRYWKAASVIHISLIKTPKPLTPFLTYDLHRRK